MTSSPAALLTVPETMARLKLGRTKVYDLIRTKRLASITEGRARRIPESSLEAYISARLEEAA
ncbi:helix-turn-helix domain-containing protein [Streptomyces noboritoensis]|uniref:Helix-turn-helix domain-containing protein n=1 Tax=Streptomyces noboritoensis TaxID=67337 RepID=A0ABV6TP35_9ACTN